MAGCWLGLGRRRLGLDSSRRLSRGLSPSATHQAMSFSCRWQKPGGHAQPPEHISSSSLCCVREPSPGAKRVRRAAPSSRRRKHALQRNAESRKQRVWRRGAAENGGPGRSVCLVLYSASTTQSWQHLLRRSFPCWRRSHHSWRPHEGSGRPPPQPRSALQTPRSRTRVYCKPASRLRQTRRIRRTEPLTRFHSVSLSNEGGCC